MTAPRPRRILVAEDSRTMADFMSRVLETAGFEIVLAHDGEECLEKARTTSPDLVILDLMMPKIHGLDVLKQLKADPPEPMPGVLVCSAKDFKTEVEQARELGAFSFLSKPFSHQELLAEVEGFFSSRNPSPAQPHSAYCVPAEIFRPQLTAAHGVYRLWGTRGSIPVSGPGFVRHGGNTSSLEVGYAHDRILFDAGSGIRDLGLSLLGGQPCHLHLFITHTHWDHIQGFPFFAPAFTPGYQITLYAPPNTDKDLESIFRGQLDRAYFPVQMEDMQAHLEFKHLQGNALEIGDTRVSWEYTLHPSPTVGYKVEVGGRSLAYVPDNEFLKGYLGSPAEVGRDSQLLAIHARLIEFLSGVDVLIHEAQYTNEEYLKKIGWGHTSLSNACALIRHTGARKWVVTHHDPIHDDEFLQRKLNLTQQLLADLGCPPEVEHGHDGMVGYL